MADYYSSLAKVNNAQGKKEDLQIQMAPYSGWQQMLTAAPLSIAILGEMMLLAGKKDFSLENAKPDGGYKCIKYPDSFRACLIHLSNDGYKAFMQAHTNMDQIRLQTGLVPTNLKEAIQIIVQGSNQEVELLLPRHLQRIQNIADDCKTLAIEVNTKFQSVMDLICELLEATGVAQKKYGDEDREIKTAIEIAKRQKDDLEQRAQKEEEQYGKMEKEVQRSQARVEQALRESPGTLDLIGLEIVGAVTSAIGSTLSAVAHPLESAKSALDTASSAAFGSTSTRDKFSDEERALFRKIEYLPQIKMMMMRFLDANDKLSSDGFENSKIRVKQELKKIKDEVTPSFYKSKDEYTKEALDICTNGLALIDEIGKYHGNMSHTDEESSNLIERVQKIIRKIEIMESYVNDANNTPPISSPGPNIAKAQHAKGSLAASAIENSHFQVEQTRQMYEGAQVRQDKAYEQLKESQGKLSKVLAELATLEMKNVSTEQIREVLKKGIKALADVKEQWAKLVEMFSMISNLIKVTLHSNLTKFRETIADSRQLQLQGIPMSSLLRDLIYNQAMEANKFAYVVHVISTSYTKVSSSHIMPPVARLSQLIAFDPDKDEHAIQMKQLELHERCDEAEREIQRMSSQENEEFKELLERRLARLENEIESVLPPIPESKKKAIKESVTKGTASSREKDENTNYARSNFEANFLDT